MSNRRKAQTPPVTRAVVEALASTLVPGEPLPRWARNPRNEAEFTAALIGRTDPRFRVQVRWDGDVAYFNVHLKEAAGRG